MSKPARIRLSHWARENGYTYHQAYRLFHRGIISGIQIPTGMILVDEDQGDNLKNYNEWNATMTEAYIYAYAQAESDLISLHEKMTELLDYCEKHKHPIRHVVQEYTKDEHQPKFLRILEKLEASPTRRKSLVLYDTKDFSALELVVLERYLKLLNTNLVVLSELKKSE